MKNKNEKQGFLKKLFGKKSDCCCSFQVEEIKDEAADGVTQEQEAPDNSCCSTCKPYCDASANGGETTKR